MAHNSNLIRDFAEEVIKELKADGDTYRLVHDYLSKQKGAK